MNADETVLAAIKVHVDRLQKLLDDPQPGLSVWCDMYGRELAWLSNFWQYGYTKP